MSRIVKIESIVPNMHLLVVEVPEIATRIQPGQFVIVRAEEEGERIPLSIADWNIDEGTITIVFMEVGSSTRALASLKEGDTLPTCVGPLGNPTVIDHYGAVMCVAGCYGIGSIYPVAKKLKEMGNTVFSVFEARSSYLLYWSNKFVPLSQRIFNITRDGSLGMKGHINRLPDIIHGLPKMPERIIVNGCTYLMARTSEITRNMGIPTIVNLNPIMIDGTGMCGVCRVTVKDQMKFACVDGPEFNGHEVDWKEFLSRRKAYLEEEVLFYRKSESRSAIHEEGKCHS